MSHPRSLRAEFQAGKLAIFALRLMFLEIVNIAGRRRYWHRAALLELARALGALNFELQEPDLDRIVEWTAGGLTAAYDATYVALAESEAITLITDDELVLATAPGVALALSVLER